MFNNYNQLIAFLQAVVKTSGCVQELGDGKRRKTSDRQSSSGDFANNSLQEDSSSGRSSSEDGSSEDSSSDDILSEGSSSEDGSSEDSVATRSQTLANERRKTEAREEDDGRFGAHNRRKYDNYKEARETDKKA